MSITIKLEILVEKKSRAQQADAPKWDLNWSERDGRYLVEYYFTDDFDVDDVQRSMISDKLAEFEEKTCVKLVEVGACLASLFMIIMTMTMMSPNSACEW